VICEGDVTLSEALAVCTVSGALESLRSLRGAEDADSISVLISGFSVLGGSVLQCLAGISSLQTRRV
jgi:hypothetical protein